MEGDAKDHRVPVMMNGKFVKAIDVYRHKNMIATRAEAIRRLVEKGLEKEMPAQARE